MIPFSKPSITQLEKDYVMDSLSGAVLSGDGEYTKLATRLLSNIVGNNNIFLTNSGTDALEMASLLVNVKPGDEIIVPSFTFSSTVNAFMLMGGKPIFCDINPLTMNMDETLIDSLVTPKTKAIYTVAYAGVPCDMDTVNLIAQKNGLLVVDDAAQAVGSYYKGRPAGTLSDFGCFSFHETKNYIMGEGGALVVNNDKYLNAADIIREKGTNRKEAIQGLVDKYTWHMVGSSYLPSDILAALLAAQLERFDEIMEKRQSIWKTYHSGLQVLEEQGKLTRQFIPEYAKHNAHMYFIVLPTNQVRSKLIDYLKKSNISAYFHYVPLHSSPMGESLGYTSEMLPKTEDYAERLLRLPLYADMTKEEANFVIDTINKFM